MGRQVKFDCVDLFDSLIQVTEYTTRTAVGPRRTGGRDCRGLRKILLGGEQACEKTP